MYIFNVFGVGFYSPIFWPVHICLWCIGFWVQCKVKSPNSRKTWLSILTVGMVLCEMLCRWVLSGYATLPVIIIVLAIWDLLFGYFAKPVWQLFGKLFRILIHWIRKIEEDNS